jgi:hypothetical protein
MLWWKNLRTAEYIRFVYHANDTLQIRDFLSGTVRFNQLDIIGTIEIAVLFDKGIVGSGFPFLLVFGLLLCFFGIVVNITYGI